MADINTPVLSLEMEDLCDNCITLNEIFNALNAMSSNKTPGNDGLTKEFYLTFFEILGSKLLTFLNYAFSVGELPTSEKQAVITLIEKSEGDKWLIKNWCPLLNVDEKIISKILTDRVKKNYFFPDFKWSDSLCTRSINRRISENYIWPDRIYWYS